MKTLTIKTPKAELLIVELPENSTFREIFGLIGAYENNSQNYHLTVYKFSDYTLLGKPDEIREEDARELVKSLASPILNCRVYRDYSKTHSFIHDGYLLRTAKESLLSLLETEIYWENPLGKDEPKCIRYGTSPERIKNLEWREAEQKTFDRNRSVIFKKKI